MMRSAAGAWDIISRRAIQSADMITLPLPVRVRSAITCAATASAVDRRPVTVYAPGAGGTIPHPVGSFAIAADHLAMVAVLSRASASVASEVTSQLVCLSGTGVA